MSKFITTAHIDYFQRHGLTLPDIPPSAFSEIPPSQRRLIHVQGVSRYQKDFIQSVQPSQRDKIGHLPNSSKYLQSEDLIVGLYGYKIPLVFMLCGSPQGLSIYLGTWGNCAGEMIDKQQKVVITSLYGLYQTVDIQLTHAPSWRLSYSGIVLGIPTFKGPESGDNAFQWDRLIRAMSGNQWVVLILAQPIHEEASNQLRQQVLNEMRAVYAGQQSERAPSPLAHHYAELLDARLRDVMHGLAVGAWRTAVYLLGDDTTYFRLASLWRGIFSGEQSQQEPLRVFDYSPAFRWAVKWAMPDVAPAGGPGHYQHPFRYQTLLNSSQLAAYVHLPGLETTGFKISTVPDFDVVPPTSGAGLAMNLGAVMHQNKITQTIYPVTTRAMQRHTLVAGITGGGKTNTVFHLLRQLHAQNVGFLVLEPAKSEYRSLLSDQNLREELRIFTLGDENLAPFRLNPFEIETGVSVATHIDLLKSVFNASFGMWTPLPQVLERCLHEVYADFGWDPVREHNYRMPAGSDADVRVAAFPTLTDLYEKAGEVVEKLGYDDKVASDIKAALLTRLNSLRIGGKGVMLDTRQSFPIAELLAHPTIVELEQIGDDDEKAFVMGLLLVRLYEYLRALGVNEGAGMRHLVVVEEAHRLLANVPTSADREQANVKGKAVETFVNMLSEIRAYGQGFLIAEQIPNKLAPDVIKNTNVKIVHRMVAGDDREILRQTMNMEPGQSAMLATLMIGQAAVFTEGDDRPLLVQVPYAKLEENADIQGKTDADKRVADHMRDVLRQPVLAKFYKAFPFYAGSEAAMAPFHDDARDMVGRADFQERFAAAVLGLVVDEQSLFERIWDIASFVRARIHQRATSAPALTCVMLHAVRWYTTTFGRNYGWPYSLLTQLQSVLSTIFAKAITARKTGKETRLNDLIRFVAQFQQLYHQACQRSVDPFPACAMVCPDGTCLYRYHNQRLLGHHLMRDLFDEAFAAAAGPDGWQDLSPLDVVADELLSKSAPTIARQRASLCFGVQRITRHPDLLETRKTVAIDSLLQAVAGVSSDKEEWT